MQQLMFLEPGRLEWQETQEPALEGPGEALVRPVVVANCDLDRRVIAGKAPIAGPFPIGHELVAEVVEVGSQVRTVRNGDLVVVPWKIACGVCKRCAAGLPSNCNGVPRSGHVRSAPRRRLGIWPFRSGSRAFRRGHAGAGARRGVP